MPSAAGDLPEEMSTMDVIDRLQSDRPLFHSGGEVRWDALPETLGYLAQYGGDGVRSLETGCGASTVVLAASGANHTTISPDPSEHELVREYCHRIGVDTSRLTFIDGFSDEVLPELLNKGTALDLAFIDGAHGFPYPVVDWHYVSRMLEVGGRLVLDDIPIPAIAVAYQYMVSESCWEIERLLDGRAAAVRLAQPMQAEDWTTQPYNRRSDFSFLPLPARAKATASAGAGRARSALGSRYPALRRLRSGVR
jgi:hypothetical protein